jgi:hypothetical protein
LFCSLQVSPQQSLLILKLFLLCTLISEIFLQNLHILLHLLNPASFITTLSVKLLGKVLCSINA